MALALTTTTVLSKRKRADVSYVVDDYYQNLELEHEREQDDGTESENDESFGTRRTKGRAKKAKITAKSKKAAKNKAEKPFRFLDLPPELRDMIYEFALLEPGALSLVAKTKNYRRTIIRGTFATESHSYYRGKKRYCYYQRYNSNDSQSPKIGEQSINSLIPNLLAVNKQIRAEASAMLYSQELILEDTTALHIFIAQIGQHNRQLLRNITIKGWGCGRGVQKGHGFAALSILSTCTNLKTLFFDCSIGWYRSSKQLARQIFRDGHYFLEAIGAAQGKYDAALDVLEISDWHFDKNREGRYDHFRPNGATPEFDPEKREEFNVELRKLLSRH